MAPLGSGGLDDALTDSNPTSAAVLTQLPTAVCASDTEIVSPLRAGWPCAYLPACVHALIMHARACRLFNSPDVAPTVCMAFTSWCGVQGTSCAETQHRRTQDPLHSQREVRLDPRAALFE